MTLNDLESRLKQHGEVKDCAQFYAPDGALISKQTPFGHLVHIPYFVMRLDGFREYNILSEKSFSFRN